MVECPAFARSMLAAASMTWSFVREIRCAQIAHAQSTSGLTMKVNRGSNSGSCAIKNLRVSEPFAWPKARTPARVLNSASKESLTPLTLQE